MVLLIKNMERAELVRYLAVQETLAGAAIERDLRFVDVETVDERYVYCGELAGLAFWIGGLEVGGGRVVDRGSAVGEIREKGCLSY